MGARVVHELEWDGLLLKVYGTYEPPRPARGYDPPDPSDFVVDAVYVKPSGYGCYIWTDLREWQDSVITSIEEEVINREDSQHWHLQ